MIKSYRRICIHLLIVVSFSLASCINYSSGGDTDNINSGVDQLRIPLGDCADFQSPAESFSLIYTELISASAGSGSKGCTGSGCHNFSSNSGGWNTGNPANANNTYANIVNRTGISGNTLISSNSLDNSYLLFRLSAINNPMPRNGELWFNTDLIRLKRWICQGAANN